MIKGERRETIIITLGASVRSVTGQLAEGMVMDTSNCKERQDEIDQLANKLTQWRGHFKDPTVGRNGGELVETKEGGSGIRNKEIMEPAWRFRNAEHEKKKEKGAAEPVKEKRARSEVEDGEFPTITFGNEIVKM